MPFTTQELFQNGKEALYYGINALSNNLIMVDRKLLKNPNGLILGTPGSGKSFSAKREIANCFLLTSDDIIICDPEAEYAPLVERLHGQVIKISPTSSNYINPMDLNLDYSDEDSPLSLKSDFILSLCELIVGGKDGLQPVQKTIIDRCVRLVYQNYLNDPRRRYAHSGGFVRPAAGAGREGGPSTSPRRWKSTSPAPSTCSTTAATWTSTTASSVMTLGIGQAAEENRDAGSAGSGVEPRHHQPGRPQVHPLLHRRDAPALERGTDRRYTVEIWKRFRKWGGIPTGITQNVKDLLSSREVENIFENSDFVYMLNQAGGDRQILAPAAGHFPAPAFLCDPLRRGRGLLFYGSTILPFVDHFPKNTELYKIMTTKCLTCHNKQRRLIDYETRNSE